MDETSEQLKVDFKLSDSVLNMKDWLSSKWIRNPDTIFISLNGMLILCITLLIIQVHNVHCAVYSMGVCP